MLKTSFKFGAIVATAATLIAGAASAATVYETFDLRYMHHPDIYGERTSHSFSSGDLNLTVTARTHTAGTLDRQIDVGRWATGLGARSSRHDSHQVDGYGAHEMVLFDFGRKVTVEKVWFSYFDNYHAAYEDDFALASYSSGGTLGTYFANIGISKDSCYYSSCYSYSSDTGSSNLTAAQRLMGDIIGIGAGGRYKEAKYDNFKIKKIKISYEDIPPVPLPASGVLLLGALGGFGLMRRRKNRAP